MKIIQQSFQINHHYPIDQLGQIESLLFFDIETTGFSPASASVYLIGCVYYAEQKWHIIQWFADTRQAEPELLTAFFKFTEQFSTLVHFNGDRFDIPFLTKRAAQFKLDYHFDHLNSIDIYKKIKPYKKWLELDSLKQKSIERFLGIHRSDLFSGGELIEVYYQYLHRREPELYHLLMLHNTDDLKGMIEILPILSYADFFKAQFRLEAYSFTSITDIFGDVQPQLSLSLTHSCNLTVPVEKSRNPFLCIADQSTCSVTIDLTDSILKHYYHNYRDYYYLPYEDMAVHKSVGEYVDKTARKKATAQTCYIKKAGLFLPQTEQLWEPVFHKEYKDKISYVIFAEELLNNQEQLNHYIHQLLDYLNY